MSKIIPLLVVIFSLASEAKTLVSLLKSITSNHEVHMSYQQKPFICTPYGVETISQLLMRVDVNSSCKMALETFEKEHPKEPFFAELTLKREQQYSVEGREGKCLLLLSAQYSYSEALLASGYARIPPDIQQKDEILDYRFNKAVLRAQRAQAGMWSDIKVRNCFLLPTN